MTERPVPDMRVAEVAGKYEVRAVRSMDAGTGFGAAGWRSRKHEVQIWRGQFTRHALLRGRHHGLRFRRCLNLIETKPGAGTLFPCKTGSRTLAFGDPAA